MTGESPNQFSWLLCSGFRWYVWGVPFFFVLLSEGLAESCNSGVVIDSCGDLPFSPRCFSALH